MKSKDLPKIVFSKYEYGDGPTTVFRNLNGSLRLNTTKRCCKIICNPNSIQLSTSLADSSFSLTSKIIQKIKHRLVQNKVVSVWSLAKQYGMVKSSVHRILKEDLKLHAYKTIIKPKFTAEHKHKRKNGMYNSRKNIFERPVVLKPMKEVASKWNKFSQKVMV
jgi:hypothetical protein